LDWSVNSSLTEAVELNSNQFLRSMLAGGTLGSYSTITANAQARTPTSRFIFDGDITYQKYWGPGTEGLPQTEFRQDGVKARYETTGKDPTDLTYGEVILRESSTSLAILSNLGIATNAQGFIDTSTVRAGFERNIRLSISLRFRPDQPTRITIHPAVEHPLQSSSAVGTWRHRLNSSLAFTASSEFEWLNFNNSSNTRIMILRDMAVDATPSPVLSFRGMAGVGYVKADPAHGGGFTGILCVHNGFLWIGRRFHHGHGADVQNAERHNAQCVWKPDDWPERGRFADQINDHRHQFELHH
jgi:hypothetical protein